MKRLPNLNYEKKLWQKGYLVVGVDEVGRGALAGPVFAGACAFSFDKNLFEKINFQKIKIADSKKLTPNQRLTAYFWIKKNCLGFGVGKVGVEEINRIGIAKASILAMTKAIKNLKVDIRKKLNCQFEVFVLSDYFYLPALKKLGISHQKPIVDGDELSFSIAAASIIAKVERDKLMIKLAKNWPFYQWEKNKGYGTKTHQLAIKKYGPTKYHRPLFIRKIIYN